MSALGCSLPVMTTKRGSQSRFQWLVRPKPNRWASLCDFPSGARQINRPSNHRLSDRTHDLLFTARQRSPKTRSLPRGAKSPAILSASPGRLTARHRYSPYTVAVLARGFYLNRAARRAQEWQPRTLPQKGITAPVRIDSGVVAVTA